jgi:hypothetical protein
MASKVETYFFLTVNSDGSIGTYAEVPAELPERNRPSNNFDVFQTCKQIAEEFENQVQADRIARAVAAALAPKAEPTVSAAVKDALKERGITPEA